MSSAAASLPQAAAGQQQQQVPSHAAPTTAEDAGVDKQDKAKKEFIKSHSGLTTVPVKVMVMADLEILDLSHNAIEVVPKGVFSDIPKLKMCDLSHNSIKSLPDDVAELRELDSFNLQHNCLVTLPLGLFSLVALKTLDISYNRLTQLQHEIGNMEGLQVLNVSGNRLRSLPADVGWLSLKQLSLVDNPDLHIPVHVLQKGFKGVMSYLQVVGEQHHQVESHMAAFTTRVAELRAKHNLLLPGALEDEEAMLLRIKLAQKLGVLSCSECNLAALPAQFIADDNAVAAVQVVDLGYNKLRSCPQDLLGCINNLLVLNLSYNCLDSWPAGLHMPSLVVLNLSFNKLQQLPGDMGQQLPALQQLYLANNYLTALPDSLAELELRDLFVSENEFQTLPQVLSNCTALVKLTLAACQLSGPCQELAGMSQLRFLDLSFNKLTALSTELIALDGVSILNLSYNALGCFPDVVSCMTCLRELNLDSTGITTFPRGLGELRDLEGLQADGCPLVAPYSTLYAKNPLLLVALHDRERLAVDFTDCGLDAVPTDLLQQTQLTSLNLSKNNIQELPVGLGQLRRLRQLSIKGNPLQQPYLRLIDARGELAVLALLRPEGAGGILDLSACAFEALPSIIWELPGRASALQELHLSNNRLRTLPEELASLVSLTRLVVDNNVMRTLPEVALKLPSLAVLQASGNRITHLPDALDGLKSLQALMVSENQLRQLPDSISDLTKLRALSVSSNRLWQLPSGITNCSVLKLLDCSHNQLGRLPQGMRQLTNLRSLKLTHNRFTWLPVDDIQPIKHLEELHVGSNGFLVEGIDSLNATGRKEVQQLLIAINASGHGVPPLMDHHSRMEGSWNAGTASGGSASGILQYPSDGGLSVGRGSISSIGGRSSSPSPLRGLIEGQSSLPSGGLLSSLKRIGSRTPSRSPSPFGRGQQEGPSNVRFSDSPAAAPAVTMPQVASAGMVRCSDGVAPAPVPKAAAGGGVRWSDGVAAGSEAAAAGGSAAPGNQSQAMGPASSAASAGDGPSTSQSAVKQGSGGAVAAQAAAAPPDAGKQRPNQPTEEHRAADKKTDTSSVHTEQTAQQQHGTNAGSSHAHVRFSSRQPEHLQQEQGAAPSSCSTVAQPDQPAAAAAAPSQTPAPEPGSQQHASIAQHAEESAAAVDSVKPEGGRTPATGDQQAPAPASKEQLAAGHQHTPAPSSTQQATAGTVQAEAAAVLKKPAAQGKQPAAKAQAKQAGKQPTANEPQQQPAAAGAAAGASSVAASKPKQQQQQSSTPLAAAVMQAEKQHSATPPAAAAVAAAAVGAQGTPSAAQQAPVKQLDESAEGKSAGETAKPQGQAQTQAASAETPEAPAAVVAATGTTAAAKVGSASSAAAPAAAPAAAASAKQPSGSAEMQQQQAQAVLRPKAGKTPSAAAPTAKPAPGQLQHPSQGRLMSEAGLVFTSHDMGVKGAAAAKVAAAGRHTNLPSPAGTASVVSSNNSNSTRTATIDRVLPPGLWALLSGLDTGAAPSSPKTWDKVPIMNIPRVVRACMQAPTPPPPAPPTATASAAPVQPARPQTRARFRRVMQQGAKALALLEYGMKQAQEGVHS